MFFQEFKSVEYVRFHIFCRVIIILLHLELIECGVVIVTNRLVKIVNFVNKFLVGKVFEISNI